MQNKCLGVFLIFLAIPLVILSILELVFITNFTSSLFYKNLLLKSNSYSQAEKLLQQSNVEQGSFLSDMAESINASWLKQNTENTLDEFFKFLNGKTTSQNISIDLTAFKKNLTPTPDLPADAITMIPDKLTFNSYKKFLEDLKSDLETQSQGQAALVSQDIADINNQIKEADNLSKQFDNNLSTIKRSFFFTKVMAYIIFGLTLLILIIIALISRSFPPAIFRWVGDALFIPAGFLTLVAFAFQNILTRSLDPLRMLKLTIETRNFLLPLYKTLLSHIFSDIIKISFIIALIGLSFIIFSYILPLFIKRETQNVPRVS